MSDVEIQIITPPQADEADPLDHGLIALTEAICQATGEESGYGLGGRFGYGENFENDVFVMRRYYWGDCDCGHDNMEWEWCKSHKHADVCYQTELRRRKLASGFWEDEGDYLGMKKRANYDRAHAAVDAIYDALCKEFGKPRDFGAAIHCTCSYEPEWQAWLAVNDHKPTCSIILPNFLHKRTGLEVRWYKWIGRGMETKNSDGVDLQAVFSECLASLPATPARAPEKE